MSATNTAKFGLKKIQRSSGELRQFTGFLEKDFKEEVVWRKVLKRDVVLFLYCF